MHRNNILKKLTDYSPEFEEEKEFRALFLQFIAENENCFERSLGIGHVTGSAWVVNADHSKFLLTHHRKLDRWLQLGGHADGNSDITRVALKEAVEESGLSSVELVTDQIFDIDIHTIPARKNEQEHLHYDIRYLFKADDKENLIVSSESKDLAWLNFYELEEACKNNRSIMRMAAKTKGSPLSKAPFYNFKNTK